MIIFISVSIVAIFLHILINKDDHVGICVS